MALPTQQQLAAIVATITEGTPEKRADDAYKIWKACASVISDIEPNPEQERLWEEGSRTVPFKKMIRNLMPTRPVPYRNTQWENYVSIFMSQKPGDTEKYMADYIKNGVDHVAYHVVRFGDWYAEVVKVRLSKRGTKGGFAKRDNAVARARLAESEKN